MRDRSGLGKALAALAPDVDPTRRAVVVTAHTTSRSLAREYRIVLNPEFQNFLINIGLRQRGYCAHFARDIGTRLKTLKLKTLVLHWGAAYAEQRRDNCLVVTARNQPSRTESSSMAGAGPADYSGARQRRPRSTKWNSITATPDHAWKENVHETAWLQDYRPSERKAEKDRCPALTLDLPSASRVSLVF